MCMNVIELLIWIKEPRNFICNKIIRFYISNGENPSLNTHKNHEKAKKY